MLLAESLNAPPGRSPRSNRRRWVGLGISGLVHGAILAALLLLHFGPRQENWLPPPTVDVIYDNGGAKQAPSVPNKATPERNAPATPPQAASSPAAPPPVLPMPPVQPPAPPVQATQPETTSPRPVPEPKPTPTPVPPQPAPPMESAIQLVPPALPPPPRLVFPRPPAEARPAPRPRPRPSFPTPMNYSLGPSVQSGPPVRSRRRGVDLAFAPMGSQADRLQQSARSDDPEVGADWLNLVSAWWRRHGYYPPQAGMNGEQGDVTVSLEVRHDGKIESVRLESRSGSQWLDIAAVSVFRDAQLPPLPPDVTAAKIPLHFTIHYIIMNH